jgi:hypothetical protein
MTMEEFYHFEAFATDHWLEILVAAVVLIFLLMQVTRQK